MVTGSNPVGGAKTNNILLILYNLGYPLDAWKVKSEDHWVNGVAGIKPFHDLKEMCNHVAERFL